MHELVNTQRPPHRKHAKHKLQFPAFTLLEVMVVLGIIGILLLIAVPKFDSLFGTAYSVEAQSQLTFLQGLEKGHFRKQFSYTTDLVRVGYESPPTLDQDGTSRYIYEIIQADKADFLARATAIADFDGDGNINVWEIRASGPPIEVVPD